MDRFLCSRCLNNRIKVPNMIESFASGATASLVAKNGTKDFAKKIQKIKKIQKSKNPKIQKYKNPKNPKIKKFKNPKNPQFATSPERVVVHTVSWIATREAMRMVGFTPQWWGVDRGKT